MVVSGPVGAVAAPRWGLLCISRLHLPEGRTRGGPHALWPVAIHSTRRLTGQYARCAQQFLETQEQQQVKIKLLLLL